MVNLDLSRSAGGVRSAFESMDFKTLAVTGAVAAFGMSVAISAGLALNNTLGITPGATTREDYAVTAAGALLAGMLMARYVGGGYGDVATIGAMVAVGAAVLGFIFGPFDMGGLPFRDPAKIVGSGAEGADMSSHVPQLPGLGGGGSVQAEGPVRAVGQGKVADFYR